MGIASEPAEFGFTAMPGIFLAMSVLAGQGKALGLTNRWTAGIIMLGIFLSFSIVAYAGIVISILVMTSGRIRKIGLVRMAGLLALIGVGIFAVSQMTITYKLVNLIDAAQNPLEYEYTSTDLSGFALISNAFVAERALEGSHYLGTGLNTHQFSYDANVSSLFTGTQIILELNRADAGSLFIRLLSEFGVPGFLAFFWFLFRYKLTSSNSDPALRVVNDACFVSLLIYAARNGNYLDIELWLVATLFCYSADLSQKMRGAA
jgi:hypothetical protein